MARPPDPALPGRILEAAEGLWQSGGDEAVTIRGVATAAGTTTPTVYSYFADRAALLVGLRNRANDRFVAFMMQSASFRNCCERYLGFGETHGRDYELLFGKGWFDRAPPERRTMEIGLFADMLVESGVSPERATDGAYAILMMLHGAVMHRISNERPSELSRRVQDACLEACVMLLRALSAPRPL
jgi:AcrR family transcriptional regulator